MRAAPATVCAASASALSRGSPAATAPSASASIARNTYAGPLPLSPVTASIMRSSTGSASPATAPPRVAQPAAAQSCQHCLGAPVQTESAADVRAAARAQALVRAAGAAGAPRAAAARERARARLFNPTLHHPTLPLTVTPGRAPTEEKSANARSPSSSVAWLPSTYALAACPIRHGVLGMTRTTRVPCAAPPVRQRACPAGLRLRAHARRARQRPV